MNVHRSSSVSLEEETVAAAVAKSALPIGVTGGLFLGLPISDLIQIITLLYLVLQVGLIVPKYWRLLAGWRRGRK